MGTTTVPATLSSPGGVYVEPLREKEKKPTKTILRVYSGGRAFEGEAELQSGVLPGRPRRIFFGAINDPRLKMRSPIPLEISEENDTVVATATHLDEFGYGSNLSEALDDFGKTIHELYFSLKAHEGKLSDYLQKTIEKLEEHLECRHS